MTFPWSHHDLPMTSPFPSLFATFRHVSVQVHWLKHCSVPLVWSSSWRDGGWFNQQKWWFGYGSIPINTIFRGMNIHLPAILMFTRGTRFWHTAILPSKNTNGAGTIQNGGSTITNWVYATMVVPIKMVVRWGYSGKKWEISQSWLGHIVWISSSFKIGGFWTCGLIFGDIKSNHFMGTWQDFLGLRVIKGNKKAGF